MMPVTTCIASCPPQIQTVPLTLCDIFESDRRLTPQEKLLLTQALLQELMDLERHRKVHAYLIPQTIALQCNADASFSFLRLETWDFSCSFDTDPLGGTFCNKPPEFFDNSGKVEHINKVDPWALGIILHILLCTDSQLDGWKNWFTCLTQQQSDFKNNLIDKAQYLKELPTYQQFINDLRDSLLGSLNPLHALIYGLLDSNPSTRFSGTVAYAQSEHLSKADFCEKLPFPDT